METTSTAAAGPIKKRRRDGKADDDGPDARFNGTLKNFELLSAVAQQLSASPTQQDGRNVMHSPNGASAGPGNGWHRNSAPSGHRLSHPRPLRPPPRFGSISDPNISTAALDAATHDSRWGVSAWLESHRTAALLRGGSAPADKPPSARQDSRQLGQSDMRKLVAQVSSNVISMPPMRRPGQIDAA